MAGTKMAIWQRLHRATRWHPREWGLLAEAWLALLGARLALRQRPLPMVLARLHGSAHLARPPIAHEPLARAVLRARHAFPIPMLCLPQSVALAWMLARRGQPCALVLGARPTDGSLDAHAWVERDGLPINSPLDSAATHPVFLREAIEGARSGDDEPREASPSSRKAPIENRKS